MGLHHSMIIDINDNVWAFGNNKYGQLVIGDTFNRNEPVIIPDVKAEYISCGSFHSLILDKKELVWGCGSSTNGQLGSNLKINPRLIPLANNVYTIAIGYNSSFIVKY